jgi:hypothetical protein
MYRLISQLIELETELVKVLTGLDSWKSSNPSSTKHKAREEAELLKIYIMLKASLFLAKLNDLSSLSI